MIVECRVINKEITHLFYHHGELRNDVLYREGIKQGGSMYKPCSLIVSLFSFKIIG